MSTTYRFVPMSEEQIEFLKHLKNYFTQHDKTTFEHAAFASVERLLQSAQAAVEPFSPLSEEEINDLGTAFWNKRLEQDVLLRVNISTIYSLGIKKGISLMEGEAEDFADWLTNNSWIREPFPDEDGIYLWEDHSGNGELLDVNVKTISELLAIFRQEQKRKKEKS